MPFKGFIIIMLIQIIILLRIIIFWKNRTADAAFSAALFSQTEEDRERYCMLAVLAGSRDACKMYHFTHTANYEDRQPLKPFKHKGVRTVFFDFYFPSRYKEFISERQRHFCKEIYEFKNGNIHGITYFKACLDALSLDGGTYHVMFMPCSSDIKYVQRFKRLNWYIRTNRRDLTSGFLDVDVFEQRNALHEAKIGQERTLEKNYEIVKDLSGKRVIIVDDILTSGQSMEDFKREIERKGGKVEGAIFLGKTISKTPFFWIRCAGWMKYFGTDKR